MEYLETELHGTRMTDTKGRNELRRKIALLTNRRRTLIEVWEFSTNRVWRSKGVEPVEPVD